MSSGLKEIAVIDGNNITFNLEKTPEYFREDFNNLKKKVSELTFENFYKENSSAFYEISQLIKPYGGFYVYCSEYGWIDLKSFIKYVLSTGKSKWIIGGILDYHF